MLILAHRAYRNGIDPARENRLEAVQDCLRDGFGVETDIRRDPALGFYISHDPATGDLVKRQSASAFCGAIRESAGPPIALNVKELGYEADLLTFLSDEGIVDRLLLFDMELLENERGRTARTLRALHPTIRIAARVSDRGESVKGALAIEAASVIWLDEFDRLWATAADVRALTAAGRAVYAISPEIHGFSEADRVRRWKEFAAWGVTGICTDFPDQARRVLGPGGGREGS